MLTVSATCIIVAMLEWVGKMYTFIKIILPKYIQHAGSCDDVIDDVKYTMFMENEIKKVIIAESVFTCRCGGQCIEIVRVEMYLYGKYCIISSPTYSIA